MCPQANIDPATMEELKNASKRNAAFKMQCSNLDNSHKQHATYFVDKIIETIQPHFVTVLDGTLFTCNYVHAIQSFVYGTSPTIIDKIAKYCSNPFSLQVTDGSYYQLTFDPTAVVATKESVKFEDVTYGWAYMPVDLVLNTAQITGARIAHVANA